VGRPRKRWAVVWADDYGYTANIVFDKNDCVVLPNGDVMVKLGLQQARIVRNGLEGIIGRSKRG
jgi:hypothetical protein